MQHKIKHIIRFGGAVAVAVIIFIPTLAHAAAPQLSCDAAALYCPASSNHQLTDEIASIKAPNVTGPVAPPKARVVTYQIASKGAVTADMTTFKTQVAQTYANAQGWSRLGVVFQQVTNGGQFTVVLAQAELVPTFGLICDDVYSCTIGNNVIINQDRWLYATMPWNQAGGSLSDYRNMVINHETGHWLGHGHEHCGGVGQPAPVMQQQSINLEGCTFNVWPLQSEIWSTTLGITR